MSLSELSPVLTADALAALGDFFAAHGDERPYVVGLFLDEHDAALGLSISTEEGLDRAVAGELARGMSDPVALRESLRHLEAASPYHLFASTRFVASNAILAQCWKDWSAEREGLTWSDADEHAFIDQIEAELAIVLQALRQSPLISSSIALTFFRADEDEALRGQRALQLGPPETAERYVRSLDVSLLRWRIMAGELASQASL